jgi:hypothetical protein
MRQLLSWIFRFNEFAFAGVRSEKGDRGPRFSRLHLEQLEPRRLLSLASDLHVYGGPEPQGIASADFNGWT